MYSGAASDQLSGVEMWLSFILYQTPFFDYLSDSLDPISLVILLGISLFLALKHVCGVLASVRLVNGV